MQYVGISNILFIVRHFVPVFIRAVPSLKVRCNAPAYRFMPVGGIFLASSGIKEFHKSPIYGIIVLPLVGF